MLLKRVGGPVRAAGFICALIIAVISQCGISSGADSSVKASVTVREEFDDNVLLTNTDKKSDFITRAAPTFSLAYKTQDWDFSMDNTFSFWHYARGGNSSYSDNLALTSKLTVLKNLVYFDVTDTYANVVVEPKAPSSDANLNVNRTDSNVLNASPYIQYEIDARSMVRAGYVYTNIWYRQNGVNRQQHKGFLNAEHKLTPLLDVVLGAEYMTDRPEGAQPSDNQKAISATIKYDLDPRTKVDGTAGYRWLSFSNSLARNAPTYNAGISYSFAELSKAEFRAQSDFAPTALNGFAETARQEIRVIYGVSAISTLNGSIYHREVDYTEINRKDKAYGLSAGFDFSPMERTKVHLSGSYEKDDFLPEHQSKNVYFVSAGADYNLTPKAVLGLTYRYQKSVGNAANNFSDNLAGVQIKMEL